MIENVGLLFNDPFDDNKKKIVLFISTLDIYHTDSVRKAVEVYVRRHISQLMKIKEIYT